MDFGAHLPLIDFDDDSYSLGTLAGYCEAARELGFAAISANDHMLFARPWLDGPTALAAVIGASGDLDLMTSVALPVVRGPLASAKMLAALDLLSGGRLIVGAGPGSSRADYEAAGLDFEERWKRFDESVTALKAFWRGDSFKGRYYTFEGVVPLPRPFREGGPPVWIGSWGSGAGLRRTAKLGDGWLASAYNTTPQAFDTARQRLMKLRSELRGDSPTVPNGLATMWTYVTDDSVVAQRVLEQVLAPMLRRSAQDLSARLLVGAPEHCAGILAACQRAGVDRVLIWPVAQPTRQLEVFKSRVEPLLGSN
jgi:alkanesulfonate monooxygenase SsuD/methylene tetrahydromethanopterin reductase-like flavin-dependent oxidoreductase (luciferase family)